MKNRCSANGRAFSAIVLAGERGGRSELLLSTGAPAKALIPVCGIPMVERVIGALQGSESVGRIYLCGPDRALFEEISLISAGLESGDIIWVQNESSPSQSTSKALDIAGGRRPILVTTADHTLLTSQIVDDFCQSASSIDADLAVALAPLELIKISYPEAERTSYGFRDGRFCSCNLFAFMNQAAFKAAAFWRQVEEKRKSPIKVIGSFGWTWAARYAAGLLRLEAALGRGSKLLGCRVGSVIMKVPEAAIDVDKQEDLILAEKILGCR